MGHRLRTAIFLTAATAAAACATGQNSEVVQACGDAPIDESHFLAPGDSATVEIASSVGTGVITLSFSESRDLTMKNEVGETIGTATRDDLFHSSTYGGNLFPVNVGAEQAAGIFALWSTHIETGETGLAWMTICDDSQGDQLRELSRGLPGWNLDGFVPIEQQQVPETTTATTTDTP